ncbi:MAG: succinate dehydrogenase, cytochrome b556 subunit [Flavobacteriaceae bacterium]|jgi:succinate dehydrogenase / fumarate reductase cytochrome b subunit|nr:succinate dehydrogenase, cytochrome b556 subunit [Flavobacteriaceae bacterium]|tara:strand:+ start:20950 stop:21321 length:372 start_codon:yes stop_codon:yes gene_type:complete
MSKPPIYLNLLKIQLPIAGISSITHRVSAVGMFVLLLPFLALLVLAANSEEGFILASYYFEFYLVKVFFNLLVAGLIYHFVSGIRHLIMDLGYWETLMAGRNSAIGTFVLSFIIFILVTLKIW